MGFWFKASLLAAVLSSLLGCAHTSEKASSRAPAGEGVEPVEQTAAAPSSRSISPDLLYAIMVGELAGQRGLYDVSLEQYLRAARESNEPEIAERAARIALFAGDQRAAAEALDLWISLSPKDLSARQLAATFHLQSGRTTAAIEHLNEVIALSGESELGFQRIVALLAKQRNKAAALNVLDQIVQQYPDDPQAWYALSLVARHAGDLTRAQAAIDKALALDPNWRKAQVTHAQILFKQGKVDQALAGMHEIVQAEPEDYAFRLSYGRMLVEAQRHKEARTQFEALLSQDPDDADVLYTLALLSLQVADPQQAKQALLRLVELDKHSDEAAYYLGQIAEDEKDGEQALRWFRSVKEGEFRLPAQIRAIALQARSGNLQYAREQLRRMRALNPTLVDRLYLIEGELLSDAGQLGEAMAMYDLALQEVPGDTGLLYARGLLAERMDRVDILERDLREILKSEPENADALNALGYTLADRTTRYDEAYVLIQQALQLKPDNAAIIDSMGWLQYRLGNYAEAVRYLRQALAKFQDAEIAAHLGEALLAMGAAEEARKVVSQALDAEPESPLLLKIWKRLER